MRNLIRGVLKETVQKKSNLRDEFKKLINSGRVNTALNLVGGDAIFLMNLMNYQDKDLSFMIESFGLNPVIQYFGGLEKFTEKFLGDKDKVLTMMMNDAKFVTNFVGGPKNLLKVLGIPRRQAQISEKLILSVNGAPFTLLNSKTSKYVVVDTNFNFGEWTSLNNYFWEDGSKEIWNITNLSNLRETRGNFGIYDITLENFGGLSKHVGNFSVAHNSNILNWDTLRDIKGNLVIYETASIKSLGSLEKIGGKIDVRGYVENLGNLKIVGGDFILKNNSLKSLGALQKIKGRLRIRNSNLDDLGNLTEVGDRILVDRNTNPNIIKQAEERNFKISKI
jgi:hypothetical protein